MVGVPHDVSVIIVEPDAPTTHQFVFLRRVGRFELQRHFCASMAVARAQGKTAFRRPRSRPRLKSRWHPLGFVLK